MAKPIPRKPDAHYSNGKSVSFTRDTETKLFRKIEQEYRFNHLANITKKLGKPEISEELYELSSENDHEYMFEVSGPDGKQHKLYFKKHLDT